MAHATWDQKHIACHMSSEARGDMAHMACHGTGHMVRGTGHVVQGHRARGSGAGAHIHGSQTSEFSSEPLAQSSTPSHRYPASMHTLPPPQHFHRGRTLVRPSALTSGAASHRGGAGVDTVAVTVAVVVVVAVAVVRCDGTQARLPLSTGARSSANVAVLLTAARHMHTSPCRPVFRATPVHTQLQESFQPASCRIVPLGTSAHTQPKRLFVAA
jgi:hypothetical protein